MNVVERAKNIILRPRTEWEVIKVESLSVSDMFNQYAKFMAAIPAVAGFLASGLFRASLTRALVWAVMEYILMLAGVYAFAYVMDILAPFFGARKDLISSLKVAIFSSTPAWIGGIFTFVPGLSILGLVAGLYSLYLLHLGIKLLKEPPQNRLLGYFFTTFVVGVVIYILVGTLAGAILFRS